MIWFMKQKQTKVCEPECGHQLGFPLVDWLWFMIVFVWCYLAVTALLAVGLDGAMVADVAVGGVFFKQLLFLETIMAIPVLLPLSFFCALGESDAWAVLSVRKALIFRILFRVLGGLFLFSIIFGWVHYSYSGRFLTVDACLFYLKSPVHLFEHALQFSPVGALALVVASLCLSYVFVIVIPPLILRFSIRNRKILGSIGGILFVLGLFLNAPWSLLAVKGSEVGRHRLASSDPSLLSSTVEDYIEGLLISRNGPWTSLLLPSQRQGRVFVPDENVLSVVYSERTSLQDYGALVSGALGQDFRVPNVILVLVESLRSDEVGVRGALEATMPNLEALIADGVLYNNHYSSSSHSSYADISAISGIYPLWDALIHIYPTQVNFPRPRIYDLLNVVGSATGIFSSQNENWGGMLNYLTSENLDACYHAGDLQLGERLLQQSLHLNHGKGFDHDTVDVALKWMQAQEQPFFAYLNLQGSHYPYYFPDTEPRPFGGEYDSSELNFLNLPAESIPYIRPRYRDSLHYVDEHLGHLVAELKRTGAWEHTVLLVTGDTGQAFREHGFSGHARDLFDEVLRTPLVISGGAFKDRGIDERLSQHVDIAPTILDLAGLPPYAGFQGLSLVGAQERTWAPLVCQSPALKQLAVVTKKYKLIDSWNTGAVRFFNLIEDPDELSLLDTNSECGQQLQALLETWAFYQLDYYRDIERSSQFFAPNYSNPTICPPK